jgi:formylmethanofuran dehydrogenase subunit E
MKYVSCSKCMQLFKGNLTKIIDGVRVCSACKSKQDRELEKAFSMYTKGNK